MIISSFLIFARYISKFKEPTKCLPKKKKGSKKKKPPASSKKVEPATSTSDEDRYKIQTVENYFAPYNATSQLKIYFQNKSLPVSVFEYNSNESSRFWIGFILITILTVFVCITQNCGHLVNEKMVCSSFFEGSASTTLIKQSMLALSIIVCFFSSIYFVINSAYNEFEHKDMNLCSFDQEAYNVVQEYRDYRSGGGDIEWSNNFFFNKFYDDFEDEEAFRRGGLADLLLDRGKIGDKLVQGNSSLVTLTQALPLKLFNMPIPNGNIAIKLPVYQKVGIFGTKNFMFNDTFDDFSRIYKKINQVKDLENQAKLEEFFKPNLIILDSGASKTLDSSTDSGDEAKTVSVTPDQRILQFSEFTRDGQKDGRRISFQGPFSKNQAHAAPVKPKKPPANRIPKGITPDSAIKDIKTKNANKNSTVVASSGKNKTNANKNLNKSVKKPKPPSNIATPSLFTQYFNQRKSFVVEAGFQAQNLKKIIETYYNDKNEMFDSYDLVNWFCFFITITCALQAIAFIIFRLEKWRNLLIFLWFPVMFISLLISYKSLKLVGAGSMLYTGCESIANFTKTYEFSPEFLEIMPTWIPRNELQQKVNKTTYIQTFQENLKGCGEDPTFAAPLFTTMYQRKSGFFTWWLDHEVSLRVELEDDRDIAITNYINRIHEYLNFTSKWFNRTALNQTEYSNSMFYGFDSLTSMTDFSFNAPNSAQNKTGECLISQDQWVLNPKFCNKTHTYKSNKSLIPSKFSKISKNEKLCFSIFDWNEKIVGTRYSDKNFKHCKSQVQSENQKNVTYAEDITSQWIKTRVFVDSVFYSLRESLVSLNEIQNMTKEIQGWRLQRNQSVRKESNYVSELAQALIMYNQTNNCSFIKEGLVNLTNNFCVNEQNNIDRYYENFSILAFITFSLGLILGILGCGFYYNPPDIIDFREIEMETVENFSNRGSGGLGKISYVSMDSAHDFDFNDYDQDPHH